MPGNAEVWDAAAPRFDDEPDHGLADPATRGAWREWLGSQLPEPPARILDIGCGTGTLAVLLGLDGFEVTGVDFSERMLELARAKATSAGVVVDFVHGDANALDPKLRGFDAIVVRHVLWAMSDPRAALHDWVSRVPSAGTIVLIEGLWQTGAGIPAAECLALAREDLPDARLLPMNDAVLWGGEMDDERYTVVGRRP
jgi:ubiquinone/menaquinone biosynthesis C-methylase UbiE